ncbi:MAG: hypothetical protein ACK514_16895 [Bacteroidota bacterium]|jgi:biopolymer transport protein ExbD|nr:hypothetical protein [Cytophagales bacterium]MCA6430797.1 hypothetical protein [Cytophagales bacterium]MCE2956019.1 hypothetical protein [Flammeovirgaceae bacterium]MCZ8069100.1 hypothetical protein [Cytophagales bacterium]
MERLVTIIILLVAKVSLCQTDKVAIPNSIDQLENFDPEIAEDIRIMFDRAEKYFFQKSKTSSLTNEQRLKKAKADAFVETRKYLIFLKSCYKQENGRFIILNVDSAAKAQKIEILPFVDEYLKKLNDRAKGLHRSKGS